MRINKFLAQSGIASRRKCDDMIVAGKVKLNGEKLTELGKEVDIDTDIVVVDGKRVRLPVNRVYYKLHKPKGYVTSASDELDRKTVLELMRGVKKRVYPIGRLDYDTEGLLLMTDDGELTNIITHPKNKVPKTYVANIEGRLTRDEISQLTKGVAIDGYTTEPAIVHVLGQIDRGDRVEITITEGKNHQIKKMFEAVSKTVSFLKRVQVGEIRLGGLSRGEYAVLTKKEMEYLDNLKAKNID